MKEVTGPGLLERKLVIVSGKGGVGKSTISAILARLASRLDKRVLVIQSDPNVDAPINLNNMLESEAFGTTEKQLHPGLWAMKIDPDSAMRYALMSVIRSKFLYNRFFHSDLVKGVVEAVPGLREAFIMYHVHAMAVYGSGRHHFDLVVWDAPPTGHLPLYLKAPGILGRMFNKGYVYKVLAGLSDYLRDPAEVATLLVTLPEETPVNETLQLVRLLEKEDLGRAGGIVINAFPTPLLRPEEEQETRRLLASPEAGNLEALINDALHAGLPVASGNRTKSGRLPEGPRGTGDLPGGAGAALTASARRRLAWEELASANLQPLDGQQLPVWKLPYFRSGRAALADIDSAVTTWLEDPEIHRYLLGSGQ